MAFVVSSFLVFVINTDSCGQKQGVGVEASRYFVTHGQATAYLVKNVRQVLRVGKENSRCSITITHNCHLAVFEFVYLYLA